MRKPPLRFFFLIFVSFSCFSTKARAAIMFFYIAPVARGTRHDDVDKKENPNPYRPRFGRSASGCGNTTLPQVKCTSPQAGAHEPTAGHPREARGGVRPPSVTRGPLTSTLARVVHPKLGRARRGALGAEPRPWPHREPRAGPRTMDLRGRPPPPLPHGRAPCGTRKAVPLLNITRNPQHDDLWGALSVSQTAECPRAPLGNS